MADPDHPLPALLDARAARLAALLDSHPGRDLLAAYECAFLDRPGMARAALAADPAFARFGQALLRQMEHAILDLERCLPTAAGLAQAA